MISKLEQRLLKIAKLTRSDVESAPGAGLAVASALPIASLPANIVTSLKQRELARKAYGSKWKKKLKGKPGAFSARHPILNALLPLTGTVSAARAKGHWESVLRKQKKGKK
jgi:hypothetical protein